MLCFIITLRINVFIIVGSQRAPAPTVRRPSQTRWDVVFWWKLAIETEKSLLNPSQGVLTVARWQPRRAGGYVSPCWRSAALERNHSLLGLDLPALWVGPCPLDVTRSWGITVCGLIHAGTTARRPLWPAAGLDPSCSVPDVVAVLLSS